jgi:hypothetical protein
MGKRRTRPTDEVDGHRMHDCNEKKEDEVTEDSISTKKARIMTEVALVEPQEPPAAAMVDDHSVEVQPEPSRFPVMVSPDAVHKLVLSETTKEATACLVGPPLRKSSWELIPAPPSTDDRLEPMPIQVFKPASGDKRNEDLEIPESPKREPTRQVEKAVVLSISEFGLYDACQAWCRDSTRQWSVATGGWRRYVVGLVLSFLVLASRRISFHQPPVVTLEVDPQDVLQRVEDQIHQAGWDFATWQAEQTETMQGI